MMCIIFVYTKIYICVFAWNNCNVTIFLFIIYNIILYISRSCWNCTT
eukprot:UN02496